MSSSEKSGNKSAQKASSFPVLRQFFSGYLHQDFSDEYGSAIGAAKAFLQDANAADRKLLKTEWETWRTGLKDLSAPGLATELRKLGAAWVPQSIQALDEIGRLFV